MLDDSKRTGRAALIRDTFVQQGPRGNRVPGPLAGLVRSGALRALNQYLLLLALASGGPKYSVRRSAQIWHHALGFPETENASAAISKNWRRLADADLIELQREGRLSAPLLLREDGHGDDYVPPDGSEGNKYFGVPFEFWLDDWYVRMTLPELAMLLVLLSELDDFTLPVAKARDWYGFSKDTAQRGLQGLHRHDLVHRRLAWKETRFVEEFYTQERFYTLQPPFGPHGRKATYGDADS